MSDIKIRPVAPADKPSCGRILFEAFQDIADRHAFPRDFATPEIASVVMDFLIDSCFGVVAERDGEILGSNFLKEGDPVVAVGPISVDPQLQESGVGRRLMQAVIDRGRDATGIRLVQDAFNRTSMALYASMGFDVREPLVLLSGAPASSPPADIEVRPLVESDIDPCSELCERVCGVMRTQELRAALGRLAAFVAIREGRVTAYATTLEFWPAAHGVAESDRDLQALLLGAASARGRPISLILPSRQAELFRFCLAEGLRILKPMTLMSMGPYQDPRGRFFPSVGY
jgi:predicted N-acetyltransferase YhbS